MPRHDIVRLLCHSSTGNYIDSICLHDVIAWFETATRQRIRVHVRCVDAIIGLTTLAAIKRHDRRNRTMRIHGDIVRQSRRSVSRSATRITPRRLSPPTDILAALPILRQSTLRWSRNPRPSAWHDASASREPITSILSAVHDYH